MKVKVERKGEKKGREKQDCLTKEK